MRALIQRVSAAKVDVLKADQRVTAGEITELGLLVFLGITHSDGASEVETIARKITQLRILPNEKSVLDLNAPVMIISQFTLYADVRKGRRPSWNQAAPAAIAQPLVEEVVQAVRNLGVRVETGEFGAHMQVQLLNDGPMTIWIEA